MKMDRKGNAKLKPKIAMNSANHSAARLRRQLTPPGLTGGVVARGSVPRAGSQQLDDAVGCYRQPIDDRTWIALSQSIFNCVGDRSRDRYRPALAAALESFGVGVRRGFQAHELWFTRDLADAHDRVVEKACRAIRA